MMPKPLTVFSRYAIVFLLVPAPCCFSHAGTSPQRPLLITLNQALFEILRYAVLNQVRPLVMADVRQKFEYFFLEPRVYGGGMSTARSSGDGNSGVEATGQDRQTQGGLRKKLSILKSKISGSGGGDQSPEPQMESSLPQIAQWKYFDMEKF